MGIFIVLIAFFFATTGIYAIIESINNLGKDKSDSSLETKWLKINAPAGFIYGIAALFIVVLLIKFYDEIVTDNPFTKNYSNVVYNQDSTLIDVELEPNRPTSVMNGKILLEYVDKQLFMKGISGISYNNHNNFKSTSIKIEEGIKFFFLTKDSVLWGVNVIDDWNPIKLEIYKE